MDLVVLPHPVIFLFFPVPSHSLFDQLGPVLFIHPRTFSTCYFMLQQKNVVILSQLGYSECVLNKSHFYL